MLIKTFADVLQGHQITDEEIYYSLGEIPILTGSNDVKGFWDKSLIRTDQLPCISYPTKGNSGVTFIQTKLFDANNTALIVIKDEFKSDILLEWLAFALRPILKGHMTNVEGVSYLNKELVDNIDLAIPAEKTQEKLIDKFKVLDGLTKRLRHLEGSIEALLSKTLEVDTTGIAHVQLNEVLSYVSRNDSLSEEGLYGIEPDPSQPTIKVLSGAVEATFYGEIPVNTPGIHFVDNKQSLHLVTRGRAGQLTYLKKGRYATNTNAFLLHLKAKRELGLRTETDEAYYLKFLRLYLEPRFLEMSSSSDVSVFPLTDVFEDMEIPRFQLDDAMKIIVQKHDQLTALHGCVQGQLQTIESLLERGIA
ncbi:MAG TPA: hypothetical protein DC054_09425 [Blastocatellia bacterium]|nr:hypothetical protein [Blastocatellia bacterium]